MRKGTIMLRVLSLWFATLLLLPAAASAITVPTTEAAGETVAIPFDPPIDENVRYRWEIVDEREGSTTMSWSINSYSFEGIEDGYRLTVTPVSSGSNEKDALKLSAMKRLAELTKRPFVLRLNESAEIVELVRSDEYWADIFKAVSASLSEDKSIESQKQARAIRSVMALLEGMPAEAKLAKLTESIQPVVEFAFTEMTRGEPIHATIDTTSPFGGTLKQNIVISLTAVRDGFAHLTIRYDVPREELEKLTRALLDGVGKEALSASEREKIKASIATLKDFKSETVADYKIWLEDGMLENFQSTQRITVREGDRPKVRVKTQSLKRLD